MEFVDQERFGANPGRNKESRNKKKHNGTDAVSTNSKEVWRRAMQPTGRIVIPGHLDPLFGTDATDAPTASWVAVQVAVTLAESLQLSGETCDVSATILSGRVLQIGDPIWKLLESSR